MVTTAGRQSRIALAALAGVVVVAAVAALMLSTGRDSALLDPGSPEGVVQAYLQDVLDGDETGALEYLTPRLHQRCRKSFPVDETSAFRVDLDETAVTDGEARVEVTIHEPSGPLGEWQHTAVFYLTETEDGWRISTRPWPLNGC
jgi:hypothetical protein